MCHQKLRRYAAKSKSLALFGGLKMKITNIKNLRSYISENSSFSESTINNVIKALGYPLNGSGDTFKELSLEMVNCAEYGANIGISGFIYYSETIPFFQKNRAAIAIHMELTAAELGTDIISMVQGFGVFSHSEKPTPSEIGKALWDKSKTYTDLTDLYNVFAWYALEEVSRTWYRYLEENHEYKAELAA
jgi:hypothetical protein